MSANSIVDDVLERLRAMRAPPAPAKRVPCDGCGGEFPLHKHLCLECTSRAAANASLLGRAMWFVIQKLKLADASAVCPNCKSPSFLTKPLGEWEIR